MISLLRRPGVVFHVLLVAFALWLGWGWLKQGPSGGELLLELSKAAEFEQGCHSVGGIAWWTPAYMQGHSLAGIWSSPFAALALELGRFFIHGIAGYKVVGLLALVAGGAAMYRFMIDFTGSAATAAWAGAFYVLCPELSVRLAEAEHIATALCFPLAPLLLHRLWKLRMRGAAHDGTALALAVATMMMFNSKVALLFLPAPLAFTLWLARGDAGERRRFLLRVAGALLLAALLSALPLLPLWREQQWMTLFAHDPMEGWQHGFTVKNALAWWDRNGALLAQTGQPLFSNGRTFYLGLVGGAALVAVLAGPGPLRGWRETEAGRRCLLFVGVALLFEWIAHGPISIWGGFLDTLKASGPLPSWSIAPLWLAFLAQLALAFLLTGLWTGRLWLRLAVVAAYLFFPFFILFEKIPLYGELRAPAAVWNVGGSFCVAVAAGLALQGVLERLPFLRSERMPWLRIAVGCLAMAVALLDFSPYLASFSRGALPDGVYADFLQAADFLRRDKGEGSVFPVSGRYFYLELPTRAGRAIWNEAATSYFQPRWTRDLVEAGHLSQQALETALTAGGVGFVFLDKSDPQAIPEFNAFLRSRYPVAFENNGFAVLRCPGSIVPALATGRTVAAPEPISFPAMLEASTSDIWPLVAGLKGVAPFPPSTSDAPPSIILPLRQPRFSDYQTIRPEPAPPGRPWVIVPESYHPDWHAEADGREVPVYRALGCFLAARAPREGVAVTFHFRPPWWYPASLAASGLAWAVALALLIARRFHR
jgi:hypothetical protein